MKRPNILILMSDEHRADVAGYAGNRVVRTPFLDWMAATGVSFSNAYTPSPVCVPARQALAAGQHCWNCNVHDYGQDLAPGYMTFARRFTEYAYHTVACGKLHHAGQDQMQGWSRRVGMDDQIETPAHTEGAVLEEFARYRKADYPRQSHLFGNKWTMAKEIPNVEENDGRHQSVVDALAEAGEDLDDWIIVYASDHGDMLGEHNFWEKACFYEGSVRVPLIIRWPKRFQGGTVVHENVNLIDLFQTLCDLAGLPAPEALDSRSLVPLMEGNTVDWDNETLSQLSGRHLMIKRDHLKYCCHEGFGESLFDLSTDPGELANRIADPHLTAQVESFRHRCHELGFGVPPTES